MAKKDSRAYFGFGGLISLILAIIPITSWICGVLTAARNKSWLWVIVRLILGFNIFWILDLITVIFTGRLLFV